MLDLLYLLKGGNALQCFDLTYNMIPALLLLRRHLEEKSLRNGSLAGLLPKNDENDDESDPKRKFFRSGCGGRLYTAGDR